MQRPCEARGNDDRPDTRSAARKPHRRRQVNTARVEQENRLPIRKVWLEYPPEDMDDPAKESSVVPSTGLSHYVEVGRLAVDNGSPVSDQESG